jgi:hypothetical protein
MTTKHPTSPWFTLNASYFPPIACTPGKLMDDADLFLDGARGIIRSLADMLHEDAEVDLEDVAQALWSAATLIEMGQRSAQVEYGRIRKARK